MSLKTKSYIALFHPIEKNESQRIDFDSVDMGWMFNSLLNFRREIYKAAYPNAGMLEGFSVGLLYSHFLQAKLKTLIYENVTEIDETLWLILDPNKREIGIEELKNRFKYPDVDLDEIDLNWRIDNY